MVIQHIIERPVAHRGFFMLTVQSMWNLAHKVRLTWTRHTSWVRLTPCVCAGPGRHACPSLGAKFCKHCGRLWHCEEPVIGNQRNWAATVLPRLNGIDLLTEWADQLTECTGDKTSLVNITDSWINMTGNRWAYDPFRWKRKWITMSKGNNNSSVGCRNGEKQITDLKLKLNCMYMLWTNYWVSSGGTSVRDGPKTVLTIRLCETLTHTCAHIYTPIHMCVHKRT